MPTVVDIANLALGHLGDRANLTSIDPPEGSAQADHCARWWPIARDEAISQFDWGWASRSATTALIAAGAQDDARWTYAYGLPADFLVARELTYANGAVFSLEPGSPLFEVGTLDAGTPVIFAGTDLAALRYTRRVSNPMMYPPLFVSAVSYLLASYLAGPVVKGKAGVQLAAAMRQRWMELAGQAKANDANQRHNTTAFKPAALRARGYGAGETTIEDGAYRRELPYWAS